MKNVLLLLAGIVLGGMATIAGQPYLQQAAIIDTGDVTTSGSFVICSDTGFVMRAKPRYQPRIEIECKSPSASAAIRIEGGQNATIRNLTVIGAEGNDATSAFHLIVPRNDVTPEKDL